MNKYSYVCSSWDSKVDSVLIWSGVVKSTIPYYFSSFVSFFDCAVWSVKQALEITLGVQPTTPLPSHTPWLLQSYQNPTHTPLTPTQHPPPPPPPQPSLITRLRSHKISSSTPEYQLHELHISATDCLGGEYLHIYMLCCLLSCFENR